MEKQEKFKPRPHGTYYSIENGKIIKCINIYTSNTLYDIITNNCFETWQEALKALKERK